MKIAKCLDAHFSCGKESDYPGGIQITVRQAVTSVTIHVIWEIF